MLRSVNKIDNTPLQSMDFSFGLLCVIYAIECTTNKY